MGCISSKLVTKSVSLREELNQSLQRANGISISGSKDLFHVLVCPTNPVANEQLSHRVSSEPNIRRKQEAFELMRNEVNKTRALTVNTVKKDQRTGIFIADPGRWSKSCHWLEDEDDYEMFSLVTERYNGNNTGIICARSRSFHTVEEYDALVEKLRSSRAMADAEQIWFNGKEETHLQCHHHSKLSEPEDEFQVEAKTVTEQKGILFSSRTETTVVMSSPKITEEQNVVDATRETSIFKKGSKRKAIADWLELTEIPTTIEFPRVASLREWTHVGGQVYSPGVYATPKFGSYAIAVSEPENKIIEGTIFDPELIAAFDECMEQLEVEEEIILKQNEEIFGKEKQGEEEILVHTKEQSIDLAPHQNVN